MEDLPLEIISLIVNWTAVASPRAARALRRTCRVAAAAPYDRHLFRPDDLVDDPEYLRAIGHAAMAIVASVRVHDRFDPYDVQDLLLKVPGPNNGRRAQPGALVAYAEAAAAAFGAFAGAASADQYMREVVAAMLRRNSDDEMLWNEAELLGDNCPYQTRAVYMLIYCHRARRDVLD